MNELSRLVDQSVWANRLWIEHVFSRADPEPRPRKLLAHIVLGEWVWFERIDGEQKTRDVFAIMQREALLRGLEENRRTYLRLIATRLEEVIDFTRASGESYHARVVDILHHLLTHGYHHRGQLAAHYAGKGVRYPSADHIDFLIRNKL